MKAKPVILIAAAIGFAVAMISCGSNSTPTAEQPAATSTGGGTPVDPATAGTVTGSIKLDGTPPKMKVINMAAEPACAKIHASAPAMTQDVVPGDGGTLQNVVVYLKGDFSQYKLDVPTAPAEIDQKGCQYEPHVLALMTNQPLSVVNSDMTTHNIPPVPKNNREWN